MNEDNNLYGEEPIVFFNKKNVNEKTNIEKSNVNIETSNEINDNNINNINSLDELYIYINSLSGQIIKDGSLKTIIYDGDINSDIMIIGEAPGKTEDEEGIPFIGKSGQLLNKLLHEIDIQRQDIYITNVIPWRPLNNRTPTSKEIKDMAPILKKHIFLKKPKCIIVLGAVATKAIFGMNITLNTGRQKIHIINNNIKVFITFHPSFLLRFPDMIEVAKKDFLYIKDNQ